MSYNLIINCLVCYYQHLHRRWIMLLSILQGTIGDLVTQVYLCVSVFGVYT